VIILALGLQFDFSWCKKAVLESNNGQECPYKLAALA
jgi:hypothetical protein